MEKTILIQLPELDYYWYSKHLGNVVENMPLGEVKEIENIPWGSGNRLYFNFVNDAGGSFVEFRIFDAETDKEEIITNNHEIPSHFNVFDIEVKVEVLGIDFFVVQ